MYLLNEPAVGFIVILLASLLLFAELLVKAKGLMAVAGSILFIYYFAYFLTEQSSTWIILILIIGLALIILDGKLFTTGLVAGLGFLMMIAACALPAPTFLYKILVGLAFIIGTCLSAGFMKWLPKRDYLEKLTLRDALSGESGYNSMNSEYHQLIGKEGLTLTPFRPVGTIVIDGKNYSAITNGIFLDEQVRVRVVSVDGTRIVIDKI